MGCFWSREGVERCLHCNRRAVNNLVIINHVCEICISNATTTTTTYNPPPGYKFGEYRCGSCGRYWNSRRCRPDKYQMCQMCKIPVLPYQYRDLKPTDFTSSVDNRQEHVQELCQMCQQLGYSCKEFGKKCIPQAPSRSRTTNKGKRSYSKNL